MSNRYKIIILVLAAKGDYEEIITASKNTWAKNVDSDVLVLFYYGNEERQAVHLEGNNLICSHPEKMENIGLKTIEALEFINKNYIYNHLVRCCAGSYIHIGNLKKYLENRPVNQFCCGIEGKYLGIKYISGSCYILSNDAVENVVKNRNRWEHGYPDDVAIGDLLTNMGFKLDTQNAKRVDLNSDDINSFVKKFRYFPIIKEGRAYKRFEDNYHFHFRNQPSYMYAVHKYFEGEK